MTSGGRHLAAAVAGAAALIIGAGLVAVVNDRGRTAPRPRSAPAPSHALVAGVSFGDDLPALTSAALDAALNDVTRLHAGWIRIDVSWADVQPSPTASYNWAPLDRVVSAAGARDLHILATLGYTPGWARAPGCRHDMCPPGSAATFAAFAASAARRYASRGVNTWEIWNEPNSAGFWAPQPDPAAYADLVLLSAARIHAADPGATVMIGGLAATIDRPGQIDTREFLTDLCGYRVTRVVDAISYHPYTYPFPATYTGTATAWTKIAAVPNSMQAVLARCGTPDLPIWVTEYGAPTQGQRPAANSDHGTTGDDHVTESWQAQLATAAVTAAEATPSVHALFWYTDRDHAGAASVDSSYGLRRADGTAKPAFGALQRAYASVEGRAG